MQGGSDYHYQPQHQYHYQPQHQHHNADGRLSSSHESGRGGASAFPGYSGGGEAGLVGVSSNRAQQYYYPQHQRESEEEEQGMLDAVRLYPHHEALSASSLASYLSCYLDTTGPQGRFYD